MPVFEQPTPKMLEQAHTPGGGGLLTGPPPPQLQLTVSVPAVTTPIPKLGCVRDADTIRVTALSSDVSALKPGNLIPGLLDCLAPSGLANINMVTRLGHPPTLRPSNEGGTCPTSIRLPPPRVLSRWCIYRLVAERPCGCTLGRRHLAYCSYTCELCQATNGKRRNNLASRV